MVAPEIAKDPTKEAAKGAVPPAMVKKRRPSDDDDDDKKANEGPPPKQGFLPTGLSRAIVIAAFLGGMAVIVGSLFGDRYDLVPAPNSANGFMYRIDRLSGDVQFCGPQGCSDIPARTAAER